MPFANAAACLQAYRRGMRRPRGGIKALVESIGERFAALGGDLRTATLVDRVESITADDGARSTRDCKGTGFVVITRRRQRLLTRQVALNLPLDLASRVLNRSLEERRLRRFEQQSRAVWSAFHRLRRDRPGGRCRRFAAVSPGFANLRVADSRREQRLGIAFPFSRRWLRPGQRSCRDDINAYAPGCVAIPGERELSAQERTICGPPFVRFRPCVTGGTGSACSRGIRVAAYL